MPVDRPYHHGNLREALVAAGVDLATEHGPDAVVLREASRRAGVSHNAGYRHFDGRDGLLSAVAQQGMDRLAIAMLAALDEVPEHPDAGVRARLRLRAVGRSYVEFAVADPGLFRTAFTTGDPGSPTTAGPGDVVSPFDLLTSVIGEFVAAGVLAPELVVPSAVTAWSAVHGFALLLLDGPLRELPASDVAVALQRLFEVVEQGMPSQS